MVPTLQCGSVQSILPMFGHLIFTIIPETMVVINTTIIPN
jgi:hypothetical protein